MNNSLSRRSFLTASLAASALACSPLRASENRRKKIAFIGTAVFKLAHSQHFLDRLLMGYTWAGGWHKPDVDLVSIYIDQFPENDLARAAAKRFDVPIYPTVEEALTRGGSKLAVDGVVIIGEHGEYPKNEKGQTLYPRYKFFKQAVGVFESSGRGVPVFNDKHLSTDWSQCVEMVNDSKRLKFPLMAGSSLPVTRRMPAIDMPFGAPLAESVCVGFGRPDSYDFHGLETAQCMSERRAGGEVGIRSVQALRGEKMWDQVSNRDATQRLLVAALARSHNLPEKDGYPTDPVSFEWARRVFPEGYAYFIEHRDGLKTTMFSLPIRDFNYAGLNSKTGEITSCQMYLPMPDHGSTTADFFNPLVHYIEQMVINNEAPYPIERTLLTSGMTLAGLESLYRNGEIVETPEMGVRYEVPNKSYFWID
ncbi:MAG TPA: hypothetical protein VHU84_18775 [Lacipirellulaceae bacterium]|jgi:hypothetical protein|nr:hypothetical protein [Lacipirellulaceae bacterium]